MFNTSSLYIYAKKTGPTTIHIYADTYIPTYLIQGQGEKRYNFPPP